MAASAQKAVPGTATCELIFVERTHAVTQRTLLILHQKYVRPDGSYYYREVRRISTERLDRINREGAAPAEESDG